MQQTFTRLAWDSDFFEFEVGRLSGFIEQEQDIRSIESLILENKSRLTYYSSPKAIAPNLVNNNALEFALVDKKTTYCKAISPRVDSDNRVISIINPTAKIEEKLIGLALQSGIYSRFKVDKKIGQEKFEALYRLWMLKSISREIAQDLLAFVEQGEVAGFVSLGKKNGRADIGIIAVDTAFRGRGIAKLLINEAEKRAADWGHDLMQVVTQGDNTPACKLYESCGYEVQSLEFFYHIWSRET